MSIYTIILILFTILLIIFYYKYPAPKRLTLEEKIAKIKQGQEDIKQRAFEKMPRFGYYIYHIAPIGSPLDEGLIDMTNTLEDLKITLFKSLSEGTYHNETLQKAWNNNEFNQDDFHILYENLSGRKACEKTYELRSHSYMGWNEAPGGWAWNDVRFFDPK